MPAMTRLPPVPSDLAARSRLRPDANLADWIGLPVFNIAQAVNLFGNVAV
jgi:hypothetical protein